MKLKKKNLLYSVAIAGILLLFLIGYFGGMLPSLYVAYVEEQNLNSVIDQHRNYMNHHSYENTSNSNSNFSLTIELPKTGNQILLSSQFFRLELTIHDESLLSMLDEIRSDLSDISFEDFNSGDSVNEISTEKMDLWKETITSIWTEYKTQLDEVVSPISIDIMDSIFQDSAANVNSVVSRKLHFTSDSIAVLVTKVRDGENYYSNYLAFTAEDNSMFVTYLPAVTPRMNEITPIVLQSMPMLIAVTILIVLLFSVFYSRKIVHPITELEQYTRNAKYYHNLPVPEICKNSKDEIASLSQALNELYTELQLQYEELEQKNQLLKEENQRQEIFLKASSHQLKTPIAATMLLVDGMINKIGKYKDTDTYLPEVKSQLLRMRKMVEDILYLRHCESNLQLQQVSLDSIVNQCIQNHLVMMQEQGYAVEYSTEEVQPVMTDIDLTYKIIDNLILNATLYGEKQSKLVIHVNKNQVTIFNRGQIADDLLPHIFEPFVTGQKDNNCHGLGLYIVSYYAKVLSASITIENITSPNDGTGVLATLCLPLPTDSQEGETYI